MTARKWGFAIDLYSMLVPIDPRSLRTHVALLRLANGDAVSEVERVAASSAVAQAMKVVKPVLGKGVSSDALPVLPAFRLEGDGKLVPAQTASDRRWGNQQWFFRVAYRLACTFRAGDGLRAQACEAEEFLLGHVAVFGDALREDTLTVLAEVFDTFSATKDPAERLAA